MTVSIYLLEAAGNRDMVGCAEGSRPVLPMLAGKVHLGLARKQVCNQTSAYTKLDSQCNFLPIGDNGSLELLSCHRGNRIPMIDIAETHKQA
jgi:hypothetical protein